MFSDMHRGIIEVALKFNFVSYDVILGDTLSPSRCPFFLFRYTCRSAVRAITRVFLPARRR